MPGPLIAVIAALALLGPGRQEADHGTVRGMTVSCQTNGAEWGTPEFGAELDRLAALGVNWVAIHPYARIHGDGRVTWTRLDPEAPPAHLAGAVETAQARGFSILVKPHLAYWGSPFSWRGEIEFEDAGARERFHADYAAWILELAEVCAAADGFAVGTELERFLGARDEAFWRNLIAGVRTRTSAHLTYAANWSAFRRVRFWDALDCIGVQAYFPLVEGPPPAVDADGRARLERGWTRWIDACRNLSERTGKPVVFTELGYDAAQGAAAEPWVGGGGHRRRRAAPEAADLELQELCLEVALEQLDANAEWLRGALLWKWFVGPAPGEDFVLDRPRLRELLARRWREADPATQSSSSSSR